MHGTAVIATFMLSSGTDRRRDGDRHHLKDDE